VSADSYLPQTLGADTPVTIKQLGNKLYNTAAGVASYNGSYTLNGWLYGTDRYTAGNAFFKDFGCEISISNPDFWRCYICGCLPETNNMPCHNLQTGFLIPPTPAVMEWVDI